MDEATRAIERLEQLFGQAPGPQAERRTRRRAIPGVLVTVEAPRVAPAAWTGAGVDVNADGIAVSFPQEIEPGTYVLLSFRLSGGVDLRRVPGVVLHHDGQTAGIRFLGWGEPDRLSLLEWLCNAYESE